MSDVTADKQRSRNLMITLLLCGGAVAYVFLVFLPQQKRIGELRKQLRNKQDYILNNASLTLTIDGLENEVTAVQQFVQQWRDQAPAENKLAALYGGISSQARQAGVKVVQFAPQQPEKLQTVWRNRVKIGFDGDFRQCFDFIGRLEKTRVAIWLSEVSLSPGKLEEEKIHGELILTIFADNREISD